MHKSQSLFYLATALHVSAVTVTRLQEHKTTVTTASGNRYTVLLSAAIVEKLELTPEICRAVIRLNKLCDLFMSLELYTRILLRCTDL